MKELFLHPNVCCTYNNFIILTAQQFHLSNCKSVSLLGEEKDFFWFQDHLVQGQGHKNHKQSQIIVLEFCF